MSERTDLINVEWRYVAFFNYLVERTLLEPFLPDGVEFDYFNDRLYLSVVGLLNRDLHIIGFESPSQQEYEQVNLRFYAKRRDGSGFEHGVVFIRQIVPDALQSLAARAVYGEPYVPMPMSHEIIAPTTPEAPEITIEYAFRSGDDQATWNSLRAVTEGGLRHMQVGSKEEFLAHRTTGFAGSPGSPMTAYHIEHPRWRYWPAGLASLSVDVATVWGRSFEPYIHARPDNAFIATGSLVAVHRPRLADD